MTKLPFRTGHVGVPPIKCQGIKTKLVPFIFENIKWVGKGDARWIEPFLGSGVVALNLAPQRAILSDTNRHIIRLYEGIQRGEINRDTVRTFLFQEGKRLAAGGADYYYEVRARFNDKNSPFDFLFLNRSCFNGVMRFNSRGKFNVPYGHKPQRFSQSYITKIVNQVDWAAKQMQGKDLEFRIATWDETLSDARPDDFVYLDPPYIGRHADYYNSWDQSEAARLAQVANGLPCGFALSMWLQNRHRRNAHVAECWPGMAIRSYNHFYYVGSSERFRNEMEEALIIRPGFASQDAEGRSAKRSSRGQQLSFDLL